jgi:hypothetical protein
MAQTLALEPFEGLIAELASYRQGQTESAGGAQCSVLPFVRGLRLSARLIYIMRERLIGSGLMVDWGHLVDEQENILSKECDIIVHRGSFRKWNGSVKPVMDFHFVLGKNAVAVVSCKTTIDRVDEPYAKNIRRFVRRVCLFGECCDDKHVARFARQARNAGYAHMWFLYTQEADGDRIVAREEILKFLGFLDLLKSQKDNR